MSRELILGNKDRLLKGLESPPKSALSEQQGPEKASEQNGTAEVCALKREKAGTEQNGGLTREILEAKKLHKCHCNNPGIRN